MWPVINATSGVSGSSRKASMTNSFCEVSLQPYGIFTHRHQPEIATHLGREVMFYTHLGNFSRGILCNDYVQSKSGCFGRKITQTFKDAYQNKPLVVI